MTRRALVIGWLLAACLSQSGRAGGQATSSEESRPQFWAIVAGIDDYGQQAPGGNSGAVRQTEAVLRWLRTRGGWENSHLLHLADLGSREPGQVHNPAPRILPTRKNLEWAFQKWLPSRAKPGDVVLFYYAGRTGSIVHVDEQTQEPRIDYFLFPADVNPLHLPSTGWSLDRALDAFPGKYRMICWLGTTVTGPVAAQAENPQLRIAASGHDWLQRLVRWPGVTAWLASDSLPAPSSENPAELFTQGLIQGLGQPDHKSNLAACLRTLHQNPKLKERRLPVAGWSSS